MQKKETLDLLQIYRGIAALMVVVYHIWGDLPFYFNKKNYDIISITSFGKYGVDFFFVLSGFIISYSYFDKLVKINDYIKNRFLRIYLPYMPIAVFLILVYTFFPSLSNSGRGYNLLASLTLIPVGETSLLPAWTLTHEMMFYIFFVISFINIKYFNFFIICWVICIMFFMNLELNSDNVQLDFFLRTMFSPYNLEFVLGYLCFLTIKNGIVFKNSLIYALVFLAFFLTISYLKINFFYFDKNLVFALSSFFFISYGYKCRNRKINSSNLFMKFGFASYSIYLIHLPVMAFCLRIIPKYNIYASFFITLIVVVYCAFIYSYFFENKFLNLLKKKI